MKKYFLFIIFVLSQTPQLFSNDNLKTGDSLAILYHKVWAYTNPADLSSRLGPYSYFNMKMVYLGESDTLPDYYIARTPDGNEAFIKKTRVSPDQSLSHPQIVQEIDDGKRKKNPNDFFTNSQSDLPWWVGLAVLTLALVLLYFLWKHFYKIDSIFCGLSRKSSRPLAKPWFITYSLFLGFVIGSIQQFIAPTEANWFFTDGLLIWANYPSFWDWILWGDLVLIALVSLGGIGQAFYRFPFVIAFVYSILTVFLVGLYFTIGIVTGGIALVLFVLYLIFSGSGGTSSAGSTRNTYTAAIKTVGNDPSPVGAFKYDGDQRYVKTNDGDWRKD